jgi:hypothetical protein
MWLQTLTIQRKSNFKRKIEIQTCVKVDFDSYIQIFFLLLYKADFDLDPKASTQPCELLYHHANPQKKSNVREQLFRGEKCS